MTKLFQYILFIFPDKCVEILHHVSVTDLSQMLQHLISYQLSRLEGQVDYPILFWFHPLFSWSVQCKIFQLPWFLLHPFPMQPFDVLLHVSTEEPTAQFYPNIWQVWPDMTLMLKHSKIIPLIGVVLFVMTSPCHPFTFKSNTWDGTSVFTPTLMAHCRSSVTNATHLSTSNVPLRNLKIFFPSGVIASSSDVTSWTLVWFCTLPFLKKTSRYSFKISYIFISSNEQGFPEK